MEEDVGVLVWEKRKSDHVTSLIHPLDLVVFSAGQKRVAQDLECLKTPLQFHNGRF